MPEIEMLLPGGNVNTDLCRLGLCTVTLIRGKRNILVDVAHFGRRVHLLEALKKRGLTPNDIHTVVLTHIHWDHAQNIDLFPKATFVIHPKEVEYSHHPNPGEWATAHYFANLIQGYKLVDACDGMELEAGVSILETPGHSPAHISVIVNTDHGRTAIAGDALSDAGAISRGLPFLVFWDEDQARASVRRLASAATAFYPGHDRPFNVTKGGEVEYLTPPTTVHLTAMFESQGNTIGLTVGLEEPRKAEIHPAAKRSAKRT